MRRSSLLLLCFGFILIATGCASSRDDVDESARLVGRENDVRIDALIRNVNIGAGSNVSLTYDVENLRPEPIAIADILPEVTYDDETGVITVLLGSEVPGNQFLPRLELIRSGETRSYSTGVSLNVRSLTRTAPRSVRIRLTYLEDVEPFEALVNMTQKALHDPELADAMFLPWVESVRFVDTNNVPLSSGGRFQNAPAGADARSPRRPPGGLY